MQHGEPMTKTKRDLAARGGRLGRDRLHDRSNSAHIYLVGLSRRLVEPLNRSLPDGMTEVLRRRWQSIELERLRFSDPPPFVPLISHGQGRKQPLTSFQFAHHLL